MKPEDIFDYNNRLLIIFEEMEGGSLDHIILSYHNKYSEAFCRYSLYMAAKGLQALHDANVIHRDIKSDNILSKKTGEIRITDLGCSVLLHKAQAFRNTLAIGTDNWVAPEIINGVAYSKEIDIWSYGCFAHELARGEPPFRSTLEPN